MDFLHFFRRKQQWSAFAHSPEKKEVVERSNRAHLPKEVPTAGTYWQVVQVEPVMWEMERALILSDNGGMELTTRTDNWLVRTDHYASQNGKVGQTDQETWNLVYVHHINQAIRLGTSSSSLRLGIGKRQGHVFQSHCFWSSSKDSWPSLLFSRVHVKSTFAKLLPIGKGSLPQMLGKHEVMRSQIQEWQRESCIIPCHLLVQLYGLSHNTLKSL